jgi:hypothetical protein
VNLRNLEILTGAFALHFAEMVEIYGRACAELELRSLVAKFLPALRLAMLEHSLVNLLDEVSRATVFPPSFTRALQR